VKELGRKILAIHRQIRAAVVAACEAHSFETLAAIADDEDGSDTIFAVDEIAERVLVEAFAELAEEVPLVLVGEGLPDGRLLLGDSEDAGARMVVVVDPIDGTRGLMYQKRSAWILTGVVSAPNDEATLEDIELAVQTEIPLIKQHLSDELIALRGEGVRAWRHNRLTHDLSPLRLRPSQATTIEHGFASVARFFAGARDVLAAIDDEIVAGVIGVASAGKANCFEDQYISAGGQLYELIAGHDRFIADLRPLLGSVYAARGLPPVIAAHPYDLCTLLVARETGVIVVAPDGGPLRVALDADRNVAWVGYANSALRQRIEPVLQQALLSRGLL
jgi:fructose-1,6-bisphosphatase/inositol monophosphatase family enzyme